MQTEASKTDNPHKKINREIRLKYIKASNDFIEALARADFTKNEFQIILVIFRKTLLFNKESDCIARSQFAELTGIQNPNITRITNRLAKGDVIIKSPKAMSVRGGYIDRYALQRDSSQWKRGVKMTPLQRPKRCQNGLESGVKVSTKVVSPVIPTNKTQNKIQSKKHTVTNNNNAARTLDRECSLSNGNLSNSHADISSYPPVAPPPPLSPKADEAKGEAEDLATDPLSEDGLAELLQAQLKNESGVEAPLDWCKSRVRVLFHHEHCKPEDLFQKWNRKNGIWKYEFFPKHSSWEDIHSLKDFDGRWGCFPRCVKEANAKLSPETMAIIDAEVDPVPNDNDMNAWIDGHAALECLGYSPRLSDDGRQKATYQGEGKPSPKQTISLIEILKAHKTDLLNNTHFLTKALWEIILTDTEIFVEPLEWIKANRPREWEKMLALEDEIDKLALCVDLDGLRGALNSYHELILTMVKDFESLKETEETE